MKRTLANELFKIIEHAFEYANEMVINYSTNDIDVYDILEKNGFNDEFNDYRDNLDNYLNNEEYGLEACKCNEEIIFYLLRQYTDILDIVDTGFIYDYMNDNYDFVVEIINNIQW